MFIYLSHIKSSIRILSQVASALSITPKCCRLYCRGTNCCLLYFLSKGWLRSTYCCCEWTLDHFSLLMNWSQVWGERRINCHCGQIKYWWSREASLVKESREIHCEGGGGYEWYAMPLIGQAITILASDWLLRSHLPECDLTHNQDRHLLHYSLPLRRIPSNSVVLYIVT